MNGLQEAKTLESVLSAKVPIGINPEKEKRSTQKNSYECLICNKLVIQQKRTGAPLLYCSDECRNEARRRSILKYAAKKRLREERLCAICGVLFIAEGQGVSGQRYCSDKCARRAENNRRNKLRDDMRPMITCPQCGKTFKRRGGKTYCTYECYIESKRQKEQISKCPICGQEFTQRGNKRKYCSHSCSTKAQSEVYRRNTATRRAQCATNGRVKKIDPKSIFERDGWRCQICGKKVDKRLYHIKGTKRYANAPSLDHIIPISKGGDHTRANVQCACYLCNCKKGNRISERGDQLLLFG